MSSVSDKLTVSKFLSSLQGYFPEAQILIYVQPKEGPALVGVANLNEDLQERFSKAFPSPDFSLHYS